MEDGAMPETETPETVEPAAVADTDTEIAPTPEAKETDLGDGGKAALTAEREARKAAERQARDLQKSLKEYEDRDKSELQKALERAEAAEKTAAEAQFSAIRSKVAAAKGVPASSLTGSTEDELSASADELIAWRDQHKPPSTPTTSKRNPTSGGGLKSGASGSENTNLDPKAAAADALRRLRAGG
jgi:hypothetical protein